MCQKTGTISCYLGSLCKQGGGPQTPKIFRNSLSSQLLYSFSGFGGTIPFGQFYPFKAFDACGRSLYMKKVWISFLIYGTFYVIWMGCKPFGTPVYSLTHPTMPTKVYLCTKRRQFLSVVFQVLLRCFCSFPNNSIGLNWICITVSVSKARILHIFGAQYTEFKIIF